jgi:hypothetical protein
MLTFFRHVDQIQNFYCRFLYCAKNLQITFTIILLFSIVCDGIQLIRTKQTRSKLEMGEDYLQGFLPQGP